MNRATSTRWILGLSLLSSALLASPSIGWEREAAKKAQDAFAGRGFVAQVQLRSAAGFKVHPDGRPADGRQDKGGGGNTICCSPDTQLRPGETGYGIWVVALKKKDTVRLYLKKKAKRLINGAWVDIVYGRPIQPADLEPARLARAVSSVITINGYEAGSDVEAAFEKATTAAIDADAGVAAPSALQGPTVRAEPARVAPGEIVTMIVEYSVSGAPGSYSEQLTLSHAGSILPGYPTSGVVSRTVGRHSSTYTQAIPGSASAGIYTLEAEVCLNDDCRDATVTFEVVR